MVATCAARHAMHGLPARPRGGLLGAAASSGAFRAAHVRARNAKPPAEGRRWVVGWWVRGRWWKGVVEGRRGKLRKAGGAEQAEQGSPRKSN